MGGEGPREGEVAGENGCHERSGGMGSQRISPEIFCEKGLGGTPWGTPHRVGRGRGGRAPLFPWGPPTTSIWGPAHQQQWGPKAPPPQTRGPAPCRLTRDHPVPTILTLRVGHPDHRVPVEGEPAPGLLLGRPEDVPAVLAGEGPDRTESDQCRDVQAASLMIQLYHGATRVARTLSTPGA